MRITISTCTDVTGPIPIIAPGTDTISINITNDADTALSIIAILGHVNTGATAPIWEEDTSSSHTNPAIVVGGSGARYFIHAGSGRSYLRFDVAPQSTRSFDTIAFRARWNAPETVSRLIFFQYTDLRLNRAPIFPSPPFFFVIGAGFPLVPALPDNAGDARSVLLRYPETLLPIPNPLPN